jgi:GNAT superfamily N-acetyltransferase
MNFRRLNQADLESFFQLRLKALENAPTAFGATLEETRQRGSQAYFPILESILDDHVILGAFNDNGLVGTIGVMIPGRSKTRHRATIWGMYISPTKQGQGIGAKLLDLAIDHAKIKMHASTIYLTVESSNVSAIKLYESRSFKTWGKEPKSLFHNGKFFDENHMTLNLTAPHFKIRPATPVDGPAIHEAHMRSIREVCAKDYPPEAIQAWGHREYCESEYLSALQKHYFLVLEIESVIQGYAQMSFSEKNGASSSHIMGLYLALPAIGKGYGIQLFQFLLNEAKVRKVQRISFFATLNAHAFYLKMGFEDTGPESTIEINGQKIACFPMELPL